MSDNIYDELKWRGLIFQESEKVSVRDVVSDGKVTVYAGFDPTSDSLHIGNLVPLITLRRFQDFGHTAIALAGGGTGLIGDPSGKSEERNLLTIEKVYENLVPIREQLGQIIDFSSDTGVLVNNYDWLKKLDTIGLLRDVGKHFSVNAMMSKDSVKSRLEGKDAGITFTEFTYMILQAYDFYHLSESNGCNMQVGGSDQWGNMTAGMELIRKKSGKESHCLTVPLVTTADGKKFGKTEKGAVWLDPQKTAPYEFYQYWINTDDRDVIHYLKRFTFLTQEDIAELAKEHEENPGLRTAHKKLAYEMTVMIHGKENTENAINAAAALFGKGELADIDEETWTSLHEATNGITFASLEDFKGIFYLLVDSGLANSNGNAREQVKSGGVYINNERISSPSFKPEKNILFHGKYLAMRRGKKQMAVVKFG